MDPITLIRSCVVIVQVISQIQADVKSNNADLARLFNRVKAMEQPLEVLSKRKQKELLSRQDALNNVFDTLNEVKTFVERHHKDNTFDKITNAAIYGNSQLTALNLRVDQSLNVLELNLTTGITLQVDDVNHKLDVLINQVAQNHNYQNNNNNSNNKSWNCPICTLENELGRAACAACKTSNPHLAKFLPSQQQQNIQVGGGGGVLLSATQVISTATGQPTQLIYQTAAATNAPIAMVMGSQTMQSQMPRIGMQPAVVYNMQPQFQQFPVSNSPGIMSVQQQQTYQNQPQQIQYQNNNNNNNTVSTQHHNPVQAVAPMPQQITNLETFRQKYEISPNHVQTLQALIQYRSILICDDSGSMNELAEQGGGSNRPMTRWDELQKMVQIILDGHSAAGSYCDIYFLNRPGILHVTSWAQCFHLFNQLPAGFTNTCAVLQQIELHEVGCDMGKSIIIHLITDGFPTDARGVNNHKQLESAIKHRKFQGKTFFSIVLCTDDEEVEELYHRIEKVGGVDLNLNYRGERRQILHSRGSNFPFTFGDYVTKVMVGSYDKKMNKLDRHPTCACILS